MASVITELERIAHGPPHNFAKATIRTYSTWAREFYRFARKPLSQCVADDVGRFLSWVAEQHYPDVIAQESSRGRAESEPSVFSRSASCKTSGVFAHP